MVRRRTICSGFAAVALGMMLFGAAPVMAAETYQVDPVHSMLIFHVQRYGASNFYGRFNSPTGTFAIDRDNPENSSFEIEVKAENVDTANQRRDDHLRSPDFFNARQFPVISFKSTEVTRSQEQENTYEVSGDLTLHGVTRAVTTFVEVVGEAQGPRGRQLMGLEARFDIRRSEYGMTFMLDSLSDEVEIVVSLEAIRQ